MAVATCLGVIVNYLGFAVIQATSSLTLKVLAQLRNVGLIVASALLLGDTNYSLEQFAGYAISLGSFASTQTLPDDHPFVRAMPYSKWHVAFTRQHDDEYRVTSPYVQYDAVRADGANGAQDLERFLADEEGLLDEDLVAWISVGREHVTRQEDLPLVSNFGVAFSLQPWNFLPWNAAASGLPP